jgi:hypothetical protein
VLPRVIFLLAIASCGLVAHDPITTKLTWSQEISRIVYKRCAECHKEGAGAMPLLTYEQARPWAKAIRDEVLNRRMPPWGAIKGFGDFRNDSSLTQEEIMRIAQWVEGGAPEGDPIYLPSRPPESATPPVPAGARIRQFPRQAAVAVLALRPMADVETSKITAHLPGGVIQPLIWLREYKATWNRTFVFRHPLILPAGTRIVSEPKAPIEFVVRSASSRRIVRPN